jgi:hypothetical protein
MSATHRTHGRRVLLLACALAALTASPALAATRYVAPQGAQAGSDCLTRTAPCTLPQALSASASGDSISLASATYDIPGLKLPAWPLHWRATGDGARPVLRSADPRYPTFTILPAQSGSTFDALEIQHTGGAAVFGVDARTDLTLRNVVIRGRSCIGQGEGDDELGSLTIVDSTLVGQVGAYCADLPSSSVIRHSTVLLDPGVSKAQPPAAVTTRGLVEDSKVDGGLELLGQTAVARRVFATGSTAIRGTGLVVDSVAVSTDPAGAAIAADGYAGGQLRVVNATAVGVGAPALVARPIVTRIGFPSQFNVLRVTNTIARGAPVDVSAQGLTVCPTGMICDIGAVRIDHSAFATSQKTGGGQIDDLGGNTGADPVFTDPFQHDFTLGKGSKLIDAGDDPQGLASPLDAAGRPRIRGAAIDIGAFEYDPQVPTGVGDVGGGGGGGGGTPPGADTTAPKLLPLSLSAKRFVARPHKRARVRTALTIAADEAAALRIDVQRSVRGRWVPSGRAQTLALPGAGAVVAHLVRRLPFGAYRFVVHATDAAGNQSEARTARFTVLLRKVSR